jgi:Putative DNA-binding domain
LNDELLNALRYKSEGTDIDFKSEQYRFIGATDHEKSELLKDILAIANAWRDGPGYILLGFKDRRPHPADAVGLSGSIDDAALQQFVNGKVKPKLTFHYEERLYQGKTVGVISIPKQKRPFYLTSPFGRLKSNIVYVRRGSSTDEAEPSEIGAMALEAAGRGEMRFDLAALTPENTPFPASLERQYLRFTEPLPDYESPKDYGPYGEHRFISARSMSYDNEDFWREYGEFVRIKAAVIKVQFVLLNRSETQLSHAKLEVSVEPLDGQTVEIFAADDLPKEPASQWSSLALPAPSFSEPPETAVMVDQRGTSPVSHIRFGTLLPSEEGRSDVLAIVPQGPGKLRLRFRILAAELAAPKESEHLLETSGAVVQLDAHGLEEWHGRALLAQYEAENGQ